MRKYISIIAVVLLLMAAGIGLKMTVFNQSNSKEIIEKTTINYLENSLAYNFTEAKKVSTGEALEAINLVESYLAYSKMAATVKSVSIIDISTTHNTAQVQAKIVRDVQAGEILETENRLLLVELVNLNGEWYVYNSTVLKMGA